MTNQELLERVEMSHKWTAQAILQLRELIKNEGKFTPQAVLNMRNEILQNVQLTISEMEILALELEAENV